VSIQVISYKEQHSFTFNLFLWIFISSLLKGMHSTELPRSFSENDPLLSKHDDVSVDKRKTISTFGGISLLVNSMTGPGNYNHFTINIVCMKTDL
jgi:hypothetical protein